MYFIINFYTIFYLYICFYIYKNEIHINIKIKLQDNEI